MNSHNQAQGILFFHRFSRGILFLLVLTAVYVSVGLNFFARGIHVGNIGDRHVNGEGTPGSLVAWVAPVNQLPIADAGPGKTVNEGAQVALDGNGSWDPDGDPLSYRWSCTGGSLSPDNTPDVTYTAPNGASIYPLYSCTLTVTDNRGGSNTDTVDITVNDVPPALTVSCSGSPSSITVGSSVTWGASPSGGSGLYQFSWSDTDQTTFSSGTRNSWTKVYNTAGTKGASVAVADTAGNTTTASCGTVTVNSPTTVNGSCSATHYQCATGTSASNVDGSTAWTWNCNGSNGGTNAACSETKPITVPSQPTGLTASCPAPGTTGTVSWTATPGATYYQLRVDDTKNGWSGDCWDPDPPNSGDSCGDVFTNSVSGPTTSGDTYAWWVHACNTSGCSSPVTGPTFTCTTISGVFPPSCTLFANPSTIDPGDSSTLSWQTWSATTGSIDNGVGTMVPIASGSRVVFPTVTTTYTATLPGFTEDGLCSANVTVILPPGPVTVSAVENCPSSVDLSWNRPSPPPRPPDNLNYKYQVNYCTGSGCNPVKYGSEIWSWTPYSSIPSIAEDSVVRARIDVMSVDHNVLYTSNTAEITLDCSISGGPQPTANLDIKKLGVGSWGDSVSANAGEDVELRWSSTDATLCTGDTYFSTGAGSPTSGTQQTVAEPISGDRTYTVRCENSAGDDATDTATVTVVGGNPTISADPTAVDYGGTTTVSWLLNGHTGCAVSGTNGDTVGSNPLTANGSEASDQLFGETTYTIACTDNGSSDSVTIRVRPRFEEI